MKYTLFVFLATIAISVKAELILKNQDDAAFSENDPAPIAIPAPLPQIIPVPAPAVVGYSVPENVMRQNVMQAPLNYAEPIGPYFGHDFNDDSSDSSSGSSSEFRERKHRKHRHHRHSHGLNNYEYPSHNYPSTYGYSGIPNYISNPFYYPNHERKHHRKHRHGRHGRYHKHSSSDSEDW